MESCQSSLPATTENQDKAFATSFSKNLDFFTRIVRNAPLNDYLSAFSDAWKENKETAFKILLNLRDIRTGKGEKLIPAVILVYLRHSLAKNDYESILRQMINYGCWKDLLRVVEINNRYLLKKNKRQVMDSITIEIMLFAEQLKKDLIALEENTNNNGKIAISLCAKWAPTEKTHFDHHPIHAATNIASAMGLTMKEYRLAIGKLRKHLNILEMLMSTQQYDQIDFSKLPSVAINKLKKAFKRDTNAEGKESDGRKQLHLSYMDYLKKLSEGKTKINVTGIQPHELVNVYLTDRDCELDLQTEAQWQELINRVTKSGAFGKVTAVADVSSSMNGQPMQVSIALGILVAACTNAPFNGKVLTFSETPEWHILNGSSLKEKVQSLKHAKWGGSTNMRAVFDLILQEAVTNKLAPEEMVETLFIFTDMQFNGSVCKENIWESTFEYAKGIYQEAGYKLPNIICWNLRTSTSKIMPVTKDETGFAMLSGFSAELLKCILDAQNITPENMMMHILEPYNAECLMNCTTNELTGIDLTSELEILKFAVEKSTIKRSFKEEKKDTNVSTSSLDTNTLAFEWISTQAALDWDSSTITGEWE